MAWPPTPGATVHVTTGSPATRLNGFGPGLMYPTSRKDAPESVETEAPEKLAPPGPNSRLSKKLPESLNPVTTLLPHQPVEVSLCVKPPEIENRKSAEGFEIRRANASGSIFCAPPAEI